MADELKCKYCGKKFIGGFTCQHSPTKKHVALANGKDCVYCGKKLTDRRFTSQRAHFRHS